VAAFRWAMVGIPATTRCSCRDVMLLLLLLLTLLLPV
jgi:hypothetical protein